MCACNRDWWQQVVEGSHREPDGWRVCTGLELREVEELLDWLESGGVTRWEVSVTESGVTVRWQA
jgi:hypothetical protein